VFGYTRRGFQKLVHDGFSYTKDRQSKTSSNWKCSLFTRFKCKARAVTKNIDGEDFVKITNATHYHDRNEHKMDDIIYPAVFVEDTPGRWRITKAT
jgi:FLYWCH zinc finger domain